MHRLSVLCLADRADWLLFEWLVVTGREDESWRCALCLARNIRSFLDSRRRDLEAECPIKWGSSNGGKASDSRMNLTHGSAHGSLIQPQLPLTVPRLTLHPVEASAFP